MVVGIRMSVLVAVLLPIGALLAEITQDWRIGTGVVIVAALAIGAIDFIRAGSPEQVTVERTVPASVVMGQDSEIRWHLVNGSARSRSVAVADEFAPSLGARRRVSIDLPGHGVGEVTIPFRPQRRGLFEPNRLTVRVDGPWKLMARQRDREQHSEIRVVPIFRSRREVEVRLHRARLLEVGARSVRARGGGTEFDHLREYTVDDSYRHVDWAATARTGHPIVRSYRAEQHQTVVVMLDNGRMMAARSGGVTRLEHAMDAVMALATVSTRVGDRLGMVTFDAAPHRVVAPGRGRSQMSVLTETMFALEPRLSESDYDLAAQTVLSRFGRRAMVVLLTDLVSPVVDASIAPAVRALSLRHEVVVGAVMSSEVAHWARTEPGDVEEAYVTGAALAAIEDRRRATARLQESGARVIDVEAGRLGPRLVDEYLELKARLR